MALKNDIKKINAGQVEKIPTLADLALKYGTISKDQHAHLLKLFAFKHERVGFEELLRDEGMATEYQLELLMLIREYRIVRKSGEEFGKIAVEKGLATKVDINQALALQKDEFKKSRHKKLIGDILVENRILTVKQKDLILKEQDLFNRKDSDPINGKSKSHETEEESRGGDDEKQSEISVVASSDHLSAWVEIHRFVETSITLNHVKDAVMNAGIVNGVYPDAFIQCFLDAGVDKFPVAWVDCNDVLAQQCRLAVYVEEENGKSIEKKKGEVLAELSRVANTVQIQNLYGEPITVSAENDLVVSCGEHTRWSRDKLKILAVTSGRPAFSFTRNMFIHPVVNILEDADYRFGPIEPYADLSVSGKITGAYSITAGNIKAEEIRGANIDALGDVHALVGITEATIRTQGDVYARYIHNSTIETFGNVYVENEIIDTRIRCSGKIESPKCRVISSKIYAKGGGLFLGVGSDRSRPTTVVAGSEHHIVALVQKVLGKMNTVLGKLEALEEEKRDHEFQAEKIFKKMIELKTFHDKSKKKKDTLLSELEKKKKDINNKILTNIQKLVSSYDRRMNSSLASLKSMNVSKKAHDSSVVELDTKITIAKAQAEKEIRSHEKILFAYMEKSKETAGVPMIEIKGRAYAGTMLGGVYRICALMDDKTGFKVEEVVRQNQTTELKFTPPLPTS
nr:FapA family protein [uncultured Desulfobacter sp.]